MRRLMLLALPLALMACGSDNDNTPTVVSLAGTWNLTTANGAALPFTISNVGGTKVELLSASVVVTSTGAFTGTEQTRSTTNGTVTPLTLPLAGTISVSGTLVTVTITGSGSVTGTLSSATSFSYVDPTTTATFVFVKQ